MKAVGINDFGGDERLELLDLPVPTIKSDEVLIQVKAAGVGNWDRLVRENIAGLGEEGLPFPLKLGWECSGVIAALGSEIENFKIGEAVIAYAYQRGTWAEYVAAPVSAIAKKPVTLSFEEAAALPVCGVTAHQVIYEDLAVQANEIVLITGGAGATGLLAVQLAVRLGAQVITTARPPNHAFLRELGAQKIIDYSQTDFVQEIRQTYPNGIDAVMECVTNQANFFQSLQTLRPGGRLVSIVNWDKTGPLRAEVKVHYSIGRPEGTRLAKLAELVDRGQLKVQVAQVFALEEARQAQKAVENGHGRGKIILKVNF
jgi:NADPH:quinone reductase-like Zn-dependent oxidoreductase